MNKKKFLNLFLIIASLLISFFSTNINVYSEELFSVVAPSKIVDLVVKWK